MSSRHDPPKIFRAALTDEPAMDLLTEIRLCRSFAASRNDMTRVGRRQTFCFVEARVAERRCAGDCPRGRDLLYNAGVLARISGRGWIGYLAAIFGIMAAT